MRWLHIFGAMAVMSVYAASLRPEPNVDCASLSQCPEAGQPCTCPDGTPATWSGKVLEEVNTELCSCYTPGCGPGPCNHKARWQGHRSEYECGDGCRVVVCFEDFLYRGTVDDDCQGGQCTGPCPNPVNPAP